MRGGVDAVGSKIDFEDIIVLNVEIFGSRMSYRCLGIGGQDNYSVVGMSDTDFIFGAYHAERFHAADFGFLDFERVSLAVVEGCADCGDHHYLSGGHIGSAADNLRRSSVACKVDGGYVQMVAVGMFHTGEHLAYDDSGKASGN